MNCILFKLKKEVPLTEQNRILDHIKRWHDGNRTGKVHSQSTDVEESLLCYVYVADAAVARNTLERLQKTSEVEYAHIPPARYSATCSQ